MKLISSTPIPIDVKTYKKYDIPDDLIPDKQLHESIWEIQDLVYARRRFHYIRQKFLKKDPDA